MSRGFSGYSPQWVRSHLGQLKKATTPRLNEWIPWTPTVHQAAFLLLDGPEVLYGGAAGGAKSVALLMAAAQYADVPGYSAILFRRTFPQLSAAKGLIPLSHLWWSGTAAKWSERDKAWTFPSGARIAFGHLQYEKDKYNHQGAEYQLVGFDEVTQFTESQVDYLSSRLRAPLELSKRLGSTRLRATANPGGEGHAWVKERWVTGARPPERVFLPAALKDNPHLDQEAYRKRLEKLPDVERRRLLNGDWNVEPGGPLWGPEHFLTYTGSPEDILKGDPLVFTVTDCKGKLHTSRQVRAGESYVSIQAFAHIGADLLLLGEEHGPWGLDDTEEAHYRLQRRFPMATHHVIENKAMGPELIRRLKKGDASKRRKPTPAVAWEPRGAKEVRYERCQPFVLAGNILVPSRYVCPWVADVVAEWARAPAPPNDRMDTLAMAVEYRLMSNSIHAARSPAAVGKVFGRAR